MTEFIRCSRCGAEIKVDEYSIQFCECGAYYRKSRDFRNTWVFAGWWKGGKGEKEKARQMDRERERKRR